MKYVFDACVALKLVLSETNSDKANRLFVEHLAGIHEFIAPDFFPTECAHVLMKAERKGTIGPGEADLFLQHLVNNSPILYPAIPLLTRAIEIALQCGASVYDCLYVALAEREGCEMVTADQNLIAATAPHYPFLISLANLP